MFWYQLIHSTFLRVDAHICEKIRSCWYVVLESIRWQIKCKVDRTYNTCLHLDVSVRTSSLCDCISWGNFASVPSYLNSAVSWRFCNVFNSRFSFDNSYFTNTMHYIFIDCKFSLYKRIQMNNCIWENFWKRNEDFII